MHSEHCLEFGYTGTHCMLVTDTGALSPFHGSMVFCSTEGTASRILHSLSVGSGLISEKRSGEAIWETLSVRPGLCCPVRAYKKLKEVE